MWNAKRVLILLVGFAGCLALYFVYSLVFGGYNGLQPLPNILLPDPKDSDGQEIIIVIEDATKKKIRAIFGNESPETKRNWNYDSPSKGILLVMKDFEILKDDGRVRLTDFSAAILPKGSPNASYPEINTITANYALLTLDKPVASASELGNRKIMAVELQGPNIVITNNRKTPLRSDDIIITIKGGSLFYEEPKDLIWTNGFVEFIENQPDPDNLATELTKITAQGLDLFLAKDTSPNRPKEPRPPLAPGKHAPVSGVEKMVLKSNIQMFTTISSQSGFLSGDENPLAEKKDKKAADKRYLTVMTNGKMVYDLITEIATFDRRPTSAENPVANDRVAVCRSIKRGDPKADCLDCEHLKLTFRRKSGSGGNGKEGGSAKEVVSALATGEIVTMTVPSDNLAAQGSELFYYSAEGQTGAKTILKGEKMWAIKDGHKIQAKELHLVGANKLGEGKHAYAEGPGHIELFDKKDPNRPYPHHLFWQKTLLSKTDAIGNKIFEKITLVGDAAFLDEENNNRLDAHTLQIWLEQVSAPGENNAQASGASRHKIHKIEAFDNVRMEGPDLQIKRANRLVIRVKDVETPGTILPDFIPVKSTGADPVSIEKKPLPVTGATTVNIGPLDTNPQPMPMGGAPILPPPPIEPNPQPQPPQVKPQNTSLVFGSQNKSKDKRRNPIMLKANSITAFVTAIGGRHELQELVCEEAVEVQQAGDGPKNKGIDIKGEWLKVERNPAGDTLTVFGDTRDFRSPARLQLGELKLIGPLVVIEQIRNLATVEGPGAMIMPSNSKLDGSPADSKEGTLTVTWMKSMMFNGNLAYFEKGVQAYQEPKQAKKDVKELSSMKCENMQVTLDKTISFKEGQKEGENPKVEKVVCDKDIYIEDVVRGAGDKIQGYSRLMSREVEVNNSAGRFIARAAVGQGRLDHLALGSADGAFGQQPEAGVKKDGQVMKLTRVQNWEQLISRATTTGRISTFAGGDIEVYHVPSDNPNVALQNDKIATGGFYLRCAHLDVFTQKLEGPGNKSRQIMEAKNRVLFQTDVHHGTADIVKFDEGTDMILLEGVNGNSVSLFKLGAPGSRPEEWRGTKILYNRRTQQLSAEGGSSISSGLNQSPQFQPVRPK